jgi:hypothetical protein
MSSLQLSHRLQPVSHPAEHLMPPSTPARVHLTRPEPEREDRSLPVGGDRLSGLTTLFGLTLF